MHRPLRRRARARGLIIAFVGAAASFYGCSTEDIDIGAVTRPTTDAAPNVIDGSPSPEDDGGEPPDSNIPEFIPQPTDSPSFPDIVVGQGPDAGHDADAD